MAQRTRDADGANPKRPRTSTQERVTIDYIKGTQFRTIHPDGAIGTRAPSGRVELAFFCERHAIPRRVVYQLNDDESLGRKIEIDRREGFVREIDLVVSMTPEVAQATADFLLSQLKKLPAKNRPKKSGKMEPES